MDHEDPANDNALDGKLPRISWWLEVDGFLFESLSGAEAFAKTTGSPIYCRIRRNRKARRS